MTSHDTRTQVVAGTAALYLCTKLHSTPLERLDPRGTLSALMHRALSFLLRTQNDLLPVLEVDVPVEEYRLLDIHGARVNRSCV